MPSSFDYHGWTIQLAGLFDGAGAWIWTAEVEGADHLFVAAGKPDDDPERVKHHVRDWIDRGMPNGGPGS
jgi:hypothetical protein